MSVNLNLTCSHPDCERVADAGSVNDRPACIDHIDWAMCQAFEPVRKIADLFKEHESK